MSLSGQEGDFEEGVTLEEALEKLYSVLPKDAIIVGQSPEVR